MDVNNVIEKNKKRIRDYNLHDVFNTPKKRGTGYSLLILFELYMFSILFTGSMEYYVSNVSASFFPWLFNNYFLTCFYGFGRSVFSFSSLVSNEFYYLYAVMIYFILLILLFFAFQRGIYAVSIGGILGMLLCYASKIKFQNRMELLTVQDLKLTEAAGMATDYLTLDFGSRFYYMLVLLLLFGVLTFFSDRLIRSDRKSRPRKVKWMYLMVGVIMASLMACALLHYRVRVHHHIAHSDIISRVTFLNDRPASFVVFRFLESGAISSQDEGIADNVQTHLMEEKGKLALQGYAALTDTDKYPNVIVIMNESWWYLDLVASNRLELSQDPLGPVKDLRDEVSWGTAAVNIFGGGTAISELEFLTGINSKYTPLVENVLNHSIVEYFNSLNYDTRAIHPYDGNFYSRRDVYKEMGFHHSTFEPDMMYRDTFDRYISDSSMVDQIIYEFENREEKKTFIFAVSIASHTTNLDYYIPMNTEYPYSITFKIGKEWEPLDEWKEEDFLSLLHRVNGVYESSAAFAKLVNYLEGQSEPVLLVMFGDHCPGIPFEKMSDLGILSPGIDKDWYPTAINPSSTKEHIEDTQRLYSVPVVSWSNYMDHPELDMQLNDLCSLGSKIIQKTNLPVTKMALLDNYYESQLATDSIFYTLDANHKPVQFTDDIRECIGIKNYVQNMVKDNSDIFQDIWSPIFER